MLVLRDGEEVNLLVALRDSHDGCNKFDQEFGHLEQGRVEMVEIIEDETLDM